MNTLFLSYAREERHFAELARIKLEEKGINVWIDKSRLRVGASWRDAIDKGIEESYAVLVAISAISTASSYVTYEWASALGQKKPVIPVLLEHCDLHPKLEALHYLDFSHDGHLPWGELISSVEDARDQREEPDKNEEPRQKDEVRQEGPRSKEDKAVEEILKYLNRRGFQMVSYERIKEKIDPSYDTEFLDNVLRQNKSKFRRARLRGGKTGLAKL